MATEIHFLHVRILRGSLAEFQLLSCLEDLRDCKAWPATKQRERQREKGKSLHEKANVVLSSLGMPTLAFY